jgi:hypothetical protein
MSDADRERLVKRIEDDPSLWRAEAWTAYAQVRDELQRVRGRELAHLPQSERPNSIKIVEDDLDQALLAMAPPERRGKPRSRIWLALKQYYSGADIERTWSAIHRASEGLYTLYDENELPAQAARLHELVAALPDLSSQLTSTTDILTELNTAPEGGKLQARAKLRELHQDAMGATESLQAEAHALRNTLLVSSGALFVVVFVLGIVHLFDDSIISLCSAASDGGEICPGGGSPHPFDVFAVELAGMLGGILSVVIPLATGERIKTPYRVFNHQLLLKIFAGAAAGLGGAILVESGLVSAFSVTSASAIIGYAIFFGFAQQALTGVIDRRASSLGEETPATKSV